LTTAAETRQAILRNARAAEHERLRTVARQRWPHLDDDGLEDAVRRLELEKLSAAGAKGRAKQRGHGETGRAWLATRPTIEARLEELLHLVRGIGDAGDAQTTGDDEAAA
jgi:hypothetical protein